MTDDGYIGTRDGVRLYFRTAGTAPDMLLIPNGLYLWDDFRPLAASRTVVFYDVRNRGRSDAVTDAARLAAGVDNDVADVDDVRRFFGAAKVDLLGHSYVGVTVALYARAFAAATRRVVQIGPLPPDPRRTYPPDLSNQDAVLQETLAALAALERERAAMAPEAFCREFWSRLAPLYVVNPRDAPRITWGRCDLPNERQFMRYFAAQIMPSIVRLNLATADFSAAIAPTLVIHGTRDRSAAYGGGRDWAALLPNARLLTVPDAAHAPWIEAPDRVFAAIDTFLAGHWPDQVERVV